MSTRRKRIAAAVGGAAVLSLGVVGGAFAVAGGDDDGTERPIPTADRAEAERAALAETGGGRVTGTEVDDEESAYEVEVTLDDGTQVDVQLDESFAVVGSESESGESDGAGDD